MSAVLTPSENQIFDALWSFVSSLFDTSVQANIFKGFQNMTSTPLGSYIVISPGVKVRQDQGDRTYNPTGGLVLNARHTTYSYQVDCYGPDGPDYADIVAIAWRTMYACDALAATSITPLYADEPTQLNIVNGELQYEQRFMCKLYLQADQVVSLPQDFFTTPPAVVIEPPADCNAIT